jgi:hypothetical protein
MAEDMFMWKAKTGIRTILTFNGRGFDYNFIIGALQAEIIRRNSKWRLTNFIPNGSSMMCFKWGRTRACDLYSFFVGSSLAKLCKEFQLDSSLQKATFPHDFIRSYDALQYVGPIIAEEYWADKSKIPKFEERYAYFDNNDEVVQRIWPEEDKFHLREFASYYLRKDVIGMLEIYKLFSREVYSRLRLNVCMYISAPQLAYDMFRTKVKDYYIPLPRNEDMQKFFQKSVYGGRVYPRKMNYESKYYDLYLQLICEQQQGALWTDLFEEFEYRIREQQLSEEDTYDALTDYICDMDVVSLYPTAMMYPFPTGKMYTLCADDITIYEQAATQNPMWLIEHWDLTRYMNIQEFTALDVGPGVLCVDIQPNTALLEPVLPRREKNDTIVWDLNPIVEGVYTTVDLCRALKRGYQITKIHSGIVFQGVYPIIREHIETAKAYKAEGDKDPVNKAAIRSFGKLILNSTYGKFLQKPRFDEVELVKADELFDYLFCETTFWKETMPIAVPNSYFVSVSNLDPFERAKALTKPTYLGAFVLSFSRLIMDKIYHAADPCQNCETYLPFYGDTDSLLLPAKSLPYLHERDLIADPANKEFGKVSNENGDARILRAYFIGPKLYALEYVTREGKTFHHHMRAKGIPSSYVRFSFYKTLHVQRSENLKSGKERGDPELVKVSFRSFMRTGIRQRVRSMKPYELVARPNELDESLALHALQYLDELNGKQSLDECQSISVPPPPNKRIRYEPLSVILVNTSRSISGYIWRGRSWCDNSILSVPHGYDINVPVSKQCC